MFKLLGFVLILIGDVFLNGHLSHKNKKKLNCLTEMILLLREVTFLIYDFKLPLEEAFRRQRELGEYSAYLWEQIQTPTSDGIRAQLLKAVNILPLPDMSAKNTIIEYFRQLGKAPKEQTKEHYQTVNQKLEAIYRTKKEEFHKNNRILSGTVYAVSFVVAILLW